MIPLPRPEYDAIEIADNARRTLGKRSAAAAAVATQALRSYLDTAIGSDPAKALVDMLTSHPDRSLDDCLNALGYVVTDPTPEPTGRKCHVVVRFDHANRPRFDIVRVFTDFGAADEFSGNTDAGRGAYIIEADFESAPESDDAELLTTMLAASERPDLDIDGDQLNMLAYDIADTMDRGEYGLGEITSDDIRAVLPAFLLACLANADANTVTGS